MKKLLFPIAFILCVAMSSCGGEQKEHKIRYGSEWSENKGKPEVIVTTTINYDGIPANRPGDTLSVATRYYNRGGDITVFEYFDYQYEDSDYTQKFHYDEEGRMISSDYEDHSNENENYSTAYIWKGGMIVKVDNFDEDGIFSYYKYTYKGNKETSNSFYSGIGVKRQQVDTSWEGDKVVKQVQKSDGSEIVRTIEYPDEFTEKIAINGFGPEDDGVSIELVITFDENGNYKYYKNSSEEGDTEAFYSYEYDATGNWIKRMVKDSEGNLTRLETRRITYY